MSTPTTRRYPRTLADAFPDERASAVEVHRPEPTPLGWRVSMWMCGVAFAGLVLFHLIGWLQ
jgi:hypothetical protein